MSIKRLIICILFSMFTFCVLLGVLVYQLHTNQEDLQKSHIKRYKSYLLADELRQSSDDLTRLIRTYVISGDERFKKYYMNVLSIRNGESPRPTEYNRIYWDLRISDGIKPRPDSLAHSLKSLMIDAGFSDQELALLQKSQESSDTLVLTELRAMHALNGYFMDRNKEFTRRGIANKVLAQKLLFSDEYHAEKAKIMRPVDQFFAHLDARTKQQVEHYTQKELSIYGQLQLLTVAFMLFSVFLCFALVKFVLKPLGGEPKDMKLIAQSIINGNLDITFGDHPRGVYYSLKEITDKLKQYLFENENRAWLQQGQVSIDQALRNEQQESKVAELVLTTIARYINAQLGSLYVWQDSALDNGDGILQQTATFGHINHSQQPVRYRLREGLVGQAAVEQKLVIQDIPQGYMRVHTSSGEISPEQIVLMPFSYRGRLRGIIELAFLSPIDQVKQDLLESLGESIGVTFENLNASQRLKEALEEAQNLSEELQVQQEELRVSNESLRNKSADLETQQQILIQSKAEIEQKAQQLERSNKYKSEFLANMSHELRTPLNSLLILARSLSSNSAGNLSTEEAYSAQVIEESGRHLLDLINHILDLSKIEAGQMKVYNEQVDLQHLQKQLTDRFNVLAKEQQIAFSFTISSDVPSPIYSDRIRLEQILMNLISNAIKFTEQGHVQVSVDADINNEQLLFTIEDTGIGIDPELHQHVFEAFQQADGSMTRKYGGTGLGLSISKDLAKLLSGSIQLQSTPEVGSKFTLVLPLVTTACENQFEQQQQVETIDSPLSQESTSCNISTTFTPVDNRTAGSITHLSNDQLSSRSILVVEDDAANRYALKSLIQFEGIDTQFVATGKEAIECLQQHNYIAVVLDLNLPDVSGFDVIETLSKVDFSTLPDFVVYTARELSDDELLRLNQSTDKVIVKSSHSGERLMEELQELIDGTQHSGKFTTPKTANTEEVDISTLKGVNVLLVDDDMRNTFSLAKLLRANGIVVDIATSGEQALTALVNKPSIDLVILDIMMPGMDGLEATAKIRQLPNLKDLPIIAFTASVIAGEKERCLQAGANDYLTKPVDIDQLFSSLLKWT